MTLAGDGAPEACRKRRLNKAERQQFLAALQDTSSVVLAAAEAGISPAIVHAMRRDDAAFAAEWQQALDEGYDRLELDLLYRLRSGRVEEQDETGAKRKYDIATGFRILAAHRQRQQDGSRGESPYTSEDAVIAAIDARLDQFRERRRLDNAALTAVAAALQVGDDAA